MGSLIRLAKFVNRCVRKEAKMSASARQKIVETIDAKRDKAIKFLQDMIKIHDHRKRGDNAVDSASSP